MLSKALKYCIGDSGIVFLLVHIDQLFASASLDGAIIVWQTEALTPHTVLNYPEKYTNKTTKAYIYNVNYLLPLNGVCRLC